MPCDWSSIELRGSNVDDVASDDTGADNKTTNDKTFLTKTTYMLQQQKRPSQ